MVDLSGKVALITGAGRGIGAAVAKELAGKEIPVSVVVGGIHACHGKILEGY